VPSGTLFAFERKKDPKFFKVRSNAANGKTCYCDDGGGDDGGGDGDDDIIGGETAYMAIAPLFCLTSLSRGIPGDPHRRNRC